MLRYFKDVAFWLEIGITDANGNFVTGVSVNYEIQRSSDGAVIESGGMTADGSVYKKQVTLSAVGSYRVLYTTPSGYNNGVEVIDVVEPFATAEELEFIKQVNSGRWVLSGSEMIFYKDDNSTEIMRFTINLDGSGNPIERVRV